MAYPSALLAAFTLSASTYTSPPISRNFWLISAMPAWACDGVRPAGSDPCANSGSTTVVALASSTPRSFSFAA